jgi:hypothetical protein
MGMGSSNAESFYNGNNAYSTQHWAWQNNLDVDCTRRIHCQISMSQCKSWKMIWKSWAPPWVKFFHWQANIGRCWTAARLAKRGLQHHPKCLLCDQLPETIHHLKVGCPISKSGTRSYLGCAWSAVHRPMMIHSMTCGPPQDRAHPNRCSPWPGCVGSC